jgi:hypothetical protein
VDCPKRPEPSPLLPSRWEQLRLSQGCGRPALRTSQNAVNTKFAEYPFHALR